MSLGNKISEILNPEIKEQVVQQVLQAELLLSQAEEPQLKKDKKNLKMNLGKYYQFLNQTLANIAATMNFNNQPETWKDSSPLEEMNKIFPGLHQTHWYGMLTNQVMGM